MNETTTANEGIAQTIIDSTIRQGMPKLCSRNRNKREAFYTQIEITNRFINDFTKLFRLSSNFVRLVSKIVVGTVVTVGFILFVPAKAKTKIVRKYISYGISTLLRRSHLGIPVNLISTHLPIANPPLQNCTEINREILLSIFSNTRHHH